MIELWLAVSTSLLLGTTAVMVLFARAAESAPWLRLAAGALALIASAALWGAGAGPASLVVAAVGAGVMVLPRHWHVTGALFFASLAVALALYAVYLVRATFLLGGDPLGVILGGLLLVLEMAALVLLITSAWEMVDALAARPPALPAIVAPARWPTVCVQIPAYNEPPDLVIETLRSVVALDYPALRVQLIDNNTTDDELWLPVKAECERLVAAGHNVEFVHLANWPGYKSGALNWGLAHLADDVEIVGIVDADYVVDPAWLRSTVPYFSDPAVAFVQTPQDYREWEQSGFYRACYAGFALFFKIGMVSRARRNSIIFAGTMGLVRRSELQDVGGWDERIITEDAELSLRLLQRGSRSVYLPVAYGRGIMPLTYEGLRKQRFRWAFGGIQILRRHWRAVLPWNRRSGLTLPQRYDHLMGGLWWFNDALALGFAAFVFTAAAGAALDRPFVVQRLSGVGIVLPLLFVALNLGRYIWATRVAAGGGTAVAMAALRVNMSLSWVIALACVRGLTQERGVFLRTPKFQGAPAIRELRLVWAETAIAAVSLALLLAVLLRAGGSFAGLALAGLLAWSLLIYGSATTFALGDPTRQPLNPSLRAKALLELRPRLGRVARARSARVGVAGALAAVFLIVAVALESDRPAVPQVAFGTFGPADLDTPRAVPSPKATLTPSPDTTPPPEVDSAIADGGAEPGVDSADPAADAPPVGPGPVQPPPSAEPPAPAQPLPSVAQPTPVAPAPSLPAPAPTEPPSGPPVEQPTPAIPVPTPSPGRP